MIILLIDGHKNKNKIKKCCFHFSGIVVFQCIQFTFLCWIQKSLIIFLFFFINIFVIFPLKFFIFLLSKIIPNKNNIRILNRPFFVLFPPNEFITLQTFNLLKETKIKEKNWNVKEILNFDKLPYQIVVTVVNSV